MNRAIPLTEAELTQLAAENVSLAARLEKAELDAKRLDYLQSHMYGADFEYGTPAISVLLFRLPRDVRVGADVRKTIDAAIERELIGGK